MSRNYATLSLETHLFFARIMKEHALFLMAGFPSKNDDYIERADKYREGFEDLLRDVVKLSDGRIRANVLNSGEIVTEYTKEAEHKTSFLTGIDNDSQITEDQLTLTCSNGENNNMYNKNNSYHRSNSHNRSNSYNRNNSCNRNRYTTNNQDENRIRSINRRCMQLLDGLIDFKEDIIRNVDNGRLYTANYPLLVEHILREAKMYRSMVNELERTGTLTSQSMMDIETFWNQIMMEHALFIRGLLDPCEEELVRTAHEYSMDYRALLEEARRKDCRVNDDLRRRTHAKTMEYRDFKAAGTEGITACEIDSIILPLLADHVLREANHYLRLLEQVEATYK